MKSVSLRKAADRKALICTLYDGGLSTSEIERISGQSKKYVDDVIEEYHYDGTITVYSRMNKTK